MVDEIVRVTAAGPLVDRRRDAARPVAGGGRRSSRSSRSGWRASTRARRESSPRPWPAPTSSESDARRLHERTAGNPLFITETVRALLEDPPPRATAGRIAFGDGESGQGMPMTLRALLGARIDALSEEARTVLRVASVIGVTFRETIVADDLRRARRARRLRAAGRGVADRRRRRGRRAGGSPTRSSTMRRMPGLLASSRRRLHARVADLLDAQSGRGAIGAVARHRAAAGDGARAVPMLAEAAEEALAVGAPAEAASFWTAAADLLGAGEACGSLPSAGAGGARGRAAEAFRRPV